MRLFEKYRPSSLDEVVGQPKACAVIRSAINRGALGGSAWWISGPSGSGKTTLARIIAGEIADGWFIREFDSGDNVKSADVDELERGLWLSATGKGGRAWIINEAHGLRTDIVRRLLGILERLPDHVVIVFTTTWDGAELFEDAHIDAGAFASRCVCLRLTNQGLAQAFAERVRTIAQAEHLDGRPIGEYVKLAQRCKNNARAMLQEVEAGAMIGGAA